MTETRYCPQCGAALQSDAPEGVCPKCVLKVGLDSDPAVSSGEYDSKTRAYTSRFVPPAPADLAKHFPHLEILELLGRGGMGAVYKARQPGLDRFVAVKILPPEANNDAAFAERFTREARALAKLTHPNIVAVHDFGQAGGLYYFVMEYVDGLNLRELERSERLRPPEALKIVPQICTALQFAHDEGIVHRDIKPENILLDSKGRVKIADFGLAKLLGRETTDYTLTGAHQVMGTPHYMAPEQLEKPLEVDHRADIYSLGVVFYEMLTGELPIGKFASPSQKVQIDVRLDEVVLRALEKEPDRRYQHASEVRTTVEMIASSSAAQLQSQPLLKRPSGFPWYFWLGASAICLLGWLLAGALWNFGTPGLFVAFAVMLGLGYGIARWAQKYAPALRAELRRRSWTRCLVQGALTVVLFTFAYSGIFTFVFMTRFVEDLEMATKPRRTGNYHELLKPLRAYQDQLPREDLYMMGGISVGTAQVGLGSAVPVAACLAILAAAAVFLDTRRYRESWANHWKPSLALALAVLASFGVAYVGVSFNGRGGHGNAGRTITTMHCDADINRVMEVLEDWMEKNGYEREWERTPGKDWRHRPKGFGGSFSRLTLAQESAGGLKDLAEYGHFELRQRPPFDYYRMTWLGLRRPKPHFSIECVSSLTPPTETVITVQVALYRFPSNEPEDWQPVLDDLVATLKAIKTK